MLEKTLADKLIKIAIEQMKTSVEFKKERLRKINLNEEFYFGRKIKTPRGIFGVSLPMMSGFVDTLMSKIDDPPNVKYGYTDLADFKLANKMTAIAQKDASSLRDNWAMKDRWSKKLACFSGRAIAEHYAESDPKYKSHWEIIDHEDFHCEPAGGGYLETHKFCGKDNVFRTLKEVAENAIAGVYDAEQVKLLKSATTDSDYKLNDDLFQNKKARFKMLGLNLDEKTYLGSGIFKLTQWEMEYEGERYFLLFDYQTGIWVRAQPLKEVFASNLYSFHSWATHEDPFIFWSKAPCDDMLPIADAMDAIFNQSLNARQRRYMGQRAYDASIFPDPSELEWRPDGLVRATAAEKGKLISQGIYEFRTPEEDVGGTINLMSFLDVFSSRKAGVNPESQGANEKDAKVGIVFSNLQQMADRLGLYNKSYNQFWEELGIREAWGASEHLSEKELIGMIGEDGVGWTEERKKAPNLNLTISGGQAELMANESKMKKRADTQVLIAKDPELRIMCNPQWRLKEVLKLGDYPDEEISLAMDTQEAGNLEILSEASQAIQDIVNGKEVKKNRGANTAFIQKILDYATDKEVDDATYKKLTDYAKLHIPIAYENMMRKAMTMKATNPNATINPANPKININETTPISEPMPSSPQAISSGNQASAIFRGKSPAPA